MEYRWSPPHTMLFSKDTMELQTYYISVARSGPELGCSSAGGQQFCYSNVVVNVTMQRRKSLFVWHIFVPCILLVATSWLSMLLPPDIIPGRMVLCITSMLAMLTLFTSSLKTMGVSYLRASDVWYVACLLFDFLIILEYSVLLWLQRRREEGEAKWGQVQPFPATDGTKLVRPSPVKPKTSKRETRQSARSLWEDLQEPSYMDEISRWVLAVFFIIFTIIFWSYYAASKREHSEQ
ncbi:glycine receptor subunit alpha-4-like [Amphibalanus amphitrite]|nr:glycine receptor subunit alpha-4-like [Amphibalanus amphitrite]